MAKPMLAIAINGSINSVHLIQQFYEIFQNRQIKINVKETILLVTATNSKLWKLIPS